MLKGVLKTKMYVFSKKSVLIILPSVINQVVN